MSASKPIPLDFVSPEWVASRVKVDPATTAEPRRAR